MSYVYVLQCVAVRCSVLQCVAACRSVLQCVAVCCRVSCPFYRIMSYVCHKYVISIFSHPTYLRGALLRRVDGETCCSANRSLESYMAPYIEHTAHAVRGTGVLDLLAMREHVGCHLCVCVCVCM